MRRPANIDLALKVLYSDSIKNFCRTFAMKTSHLFNLGFIVLLFAGCATTHPTAPEPDVLSISVNGDSGAALTGFYIRDGQRTDLSGNIPWTFALDGVSQLEIRKLNPESTADAEVHFQSHQADFSNTLAVGPGIKGVRVNVNSGFALTAINE
jgi:hypothetical protein